MASSPLTSAILFQIGAVPITRPVATSWVIMAVLTLASMLATRRLHARPERYQAAVEGRIPAYALAAIPAVTPGTTSNGTPARASFW